MEHVRWGFIGCGEVTEKKSGPAFNLIEGSEVGQWFQMAGVKSFCYVPKTGIQN